MGVELGHHPGGWHVIESRGRSYLRGHHQPVGAPVPAHGEEPLRVRVLLEPAQPQLEELRRDGAVGHLHLFGDVGEPAHHAGGHRHPRRQVGAPRLDVEAARAKNVVVADAVGSREPARVVDQVAHRPSPGASRSGSRVFLRRPPWRGPPYTGEQGRRRGIRSFHLSPPIARLGFRGAS